MRCCRIAIAALIFEAFSPVYVQAETAYFVVGEVSFPFHLYDSYLLPLTDPAAIAHARNLIRFGPGIGESLAVAWIAPGSDGKNRNFNDPDLPFWSWHVTSFEGFADITAEILDGAPSGVEADVEWWMQNTGGAIGFWNYTVVAEFRPGDYDLNLVVDADDFEFWKSGYGVPGWADGNRDGRTSAADFTVWRDHLGSRITLPTPPGEGLSVVPEPATGGIVLLFAVLTWMRMLFSRGLHVRGNSG